MRPDPAADPTLWLPAPSSRLPLGIATGEPAFYPWVTPGDPPERRLQRLICSFRTREDEVDRFLDRVRVVVAQTLG